MRNLNRWTGIGRIGQDPDKKTTPNGNVVINFSMACQDDYKDSNGEKVERVEWVRIVMWGKGAEIFSQYAKKGTKVYVEGALRTRKWQDKEGRDQYTTEVNATNFELVSSKQEAGQGGGQSRATEQPAHAADTDFDDDIPF